MATKSTLRKLETKVKKYHSLTDMRLMVLKENPSIENRERYYFASDKLDDTLDEYYGASIMFFSIEKKELYELYIDQPKTEVKKKFLRQITKSKNSTLAYKENEHRLDVLEKEKIALIKKKYKGVKLTRINKNISRLKRWMEYE